MVEISPGRVVLVTGASTGIGRLCAERLAAAGWRVFGGARSVTATAPASRANLDWLPMDVTDDASVRAVIDKILATTGRLDAIVNNAGFSMRGSVEDVPMEQARAIFETNFFGALRVCRAAAPALRAHGGYIVNISSLAGLVGLPFTAHYCASKFALEGLSESLRYELRPYGVHVVLVEPGDYRTGIQVSRRISAETQQGVYARFRCVSTKKAGVRGAIRDSRAGRGAGRKDSERSASKITLCDRHAGAGFAAALAASVAARPL